MVDSSNTRRRHHKSREDREDDSYKTEIRSGGSSDTEDEDEQKYKRDIQQRRKKRKRRKEKDEPPFFVLFAQVSAVLFMLCLASYHGYRYINPATGRSLVGDDDAPDYDVTVDDGDSHYREEQKIKLQKLMHRNKDIEMPPQAKAKPKVTAPPKKVLNKTKTIAPEKIMPPLPVFDLSSSSNWDAFGLLNTLQHSNGHSKFWKAVEDLKTRFSETYGGENAARMLLDRGLTTTRSSKDAQPPSDVVDTACRLHRAKSQKRSFRMAFGGYSVTTGRGNKHQDSYPFRLQELLEPLLNLAGSSMAIRNAAIGGIPSFPYGWCLSEFLGDMPDVVSWDFGMNEATGGPEGLEAYVRHLVTTYASSSPKLIVKDYYAAHQRRELLKQYASVLKDPVVLHTDHAIEPILNATKGAPSQTDTDQDWRRPPGFRKWREWGAPKGAPGQASHHPAVQEHKLNAWILAMHFVTALEYMVVMEEKGDQKWCLQLDDSAPEALPPPVSRSILNDTKLEYDGILFGYPSGDGWKMNPVRCRTTFEPKVSGDLSEIVVNGTMGEDLDPILPKSQYYYNKGWTYDLSEAEKTTNRKLDTYPDGLGFKDSKEAYYGIYESPPMTLLLPYESTASQPSIGDSASDWFESIVVCQVNDKNTLDSAFSDPNTCKFETDVSIRIGGVNVTQNATKMFRTIGSTYLGKPICKHLEIPSAAKLTSHNELVLQAKNAAAASSKNVVVDADAENQPKTDQVGLLVQVFVSNPHIVHVHQACSLSHVIWEERPTPTKPRADPNAPSLEKD